MSSNSKTPEGAAVTQRPPRLLARMLLMLVPLFLIGLVGMLWGSSNLPETSRNWFGSVLAGDIVRPLGYALGLIIVGWTFRRLARIDRIGPWPARIADVLFAAAGFALVGGAVLAVDRALPWPGLPDVLPPLVWLAYGGVLAWRLKLFAGQRLRPAWVLLGLGVGLLVSAPWAITGALGTTSELLLAVLEAGGISAVGAVFLLLLFRHDPLILVRRPFWSMLLAGAVFGALQAIFFAVRGWSTQSATLVPTMVFYGMAASALMTTTIDAGGPADSVGFAAAPLWAYLFAATLLPLAFTDASDGEYIPGGLVTGMGPLVSMLFAPAAATLLLLARRRCGPLRARSAAVIGGASTALAVLLYLGLGQPGLQADSYFVVMREQADTSQAHTIPHVGERRAAVYKTLVEAANTSQADLRAYLDERQIPYKPYYLVNGVEVHGDALLRLTLLQRADVAAVLDAPTIRPVRATGRSGPIQLAEEVPAPRGIAWDVAAVHAPEVWQAGYTGQGVVVGVIGGGADWQHPAVRDTFRGANGNFDYAWLDAWRGAPEPEDVNALGTHTVGIVAGKDGIGVAPGAEWIACRSLARDVGNVLMYLTCMQFTLAPYPRSGDAFTGGDPARGADLIEAAWDCPVWEGCDASTLSIGVAHLADAGQMFITGTGNNGPACGTIDPPGLAEDAFTVGSLDRQLHIADFSSRGPITADGSGRIKPDVVAPGAGIISAMPDGRYAQLGGSSMASSLVSGVVALLWSADPALIGDVERTKTILTQSAEPVYGGSNVCGDPHNSSGYGRVDAYAALQLLMKDGYPQGQTRP